ncbi:hypothetical protein [Cellulomonas xiejunii]|uniref:DUF4245 domain-containing protein n=1 Tax=Cellulomonas xiejunii TaxID=2968083 RepID=A0ABY5KNN7_9CELL|nr:hypothetical protein [Cellulomonas xiejunii]MCC2312737.1 hypothetical protein [Cellulomonas xiejunii]MCC2320393.1 hypothetical protein [Cellulomonas xiejunii]UUI70690.1 hypothetical protein NP048_12910 [Cellulomonas xiejunii]
MARRAAMVTVCGAVLGVVLAGCAAPEEVALTTPEGWQRVESGALTFAVPGDWVEVPQSDDLWGVGWSTDAAPGPGSLLVVGAADLGDDGAEQALDTFVAGAQVGGWGYGSTGRSTPVDTAALEVQRNDFTYDDVEGVVWTASDPDSGRAVGLQLTGRDLPPEVVAGIEESIAVLRVDEG